jgi:hypothetical protein
MDSNSRFRLVSAIHRSRDDITTALAGWISPAQFAHLHAKARNARQEMAGHLINFA